MLAFAVRRSTVRSELRRVRMGISMSSADASKKDITVLSAMRKIDTCSTATARSLARSAELPSMYSVRSTFSPPLYRWSVRGANFAEPGDAGGLLDFGGLPLLLALVSLCVYADGSSSWMGSEEERWLGVCL